MKKLTTVAVTTVANGQITLSADQAKTRLHQIRPVKVSKETLAGVYEIVIPVQFKQGESFGYDGELNKAGVLHHPESEMPRGQIREARAEGPTFAQSRDAQA